MKIKVLFRKQGTLIQITHLNNRVHVAIMKWMQDKGNIKSK